MQHVCVNALIHFASILFQWTGLVAILLNIGIFHSVHTAGDFDADNCNKCVDSGGKSCDDLLIRFQQTRYWVPSLDSYGSGFTFEESRKLCQHSRLTLALLTQNNEDLERAINSSKFDHYWLVKQDVNSSEMQPVAVTGKVELKQLELDQNASLVCQFDDGSNCLFNSAELSPDPRITATGYIRKPFEDSTSATTNAPTDAGNSTRKRRKCKSLLFGNRLSLRS